MKKLSTISTAMLLCSLSLLAQPTVGTNYLGNALVSMLTVVNTNNGGFPGSILFQLQGYSGIFGAAGGGAIYLTPEAPSSSQFIITRDVSVTGNITASGNVSAANTIMWTTNIVWSTNAFYAAIATNTPDLQPIPWKAGTNVWTGTNTYTGTVKFNGPVYATGAGITNIPVANINGSFSTTPIPMGLGNVNNSGYGVLLGGLYNTDSGYSSTILGGSGNINQGGWASMVGGNGNTISSNGPTVNCCGVGPEIAGQYSTIGGGADNLITTVNATVAGGAECRIVNGGYGSAIAGGDTITISGEWSFVGGGNFNTNGGALSVITGGQNNLIVGISTNGLGPVSSWDVISGGRQNTIADSVVNGTIEGGYLNQVIGNGGTVAGGSDNIAGYSSFACGALAWATNRNCFVWNDVSGGGNPYGSTADNIVQFKSLNGLKLDGGPFQGNGIALTNQISAPTPIANQVILWYSNSVLWATGPNHTLPVLQGL